MDRVAGKVAIVTGAASGMGQADAILLAAQGATVVLADLNESAGQAVVKEIGKDAIFMRLDVSDEENWKQVIAATLETFGRLDIWSITPVLLPLVVLLTPRWNLGA